MNKKVAIIIISVLVVLLIGAGVGLFLFIGSSKEKEEEFFTYSVGEAFVTNMKDSNSLVKTSISVVCNTKGLDEQFKAENAYIRNTIVFAIRSKTKEEMKSPEIETELSKEIVDKLNSGLNVDYFKKIYFSDLVIQ